MDNIETLMSGTDARKMWCSPVDDIGRVNVGQAAGHVGGNVGAAGVPAILLTPRPVQRSAQVAALHHSI